MAKLNENIFRQNDVRGTVPDQLSPQIAKQVGKSFGTYLKREGVDSCVVGRDARGSSEHLSTAFQKGLLETGCDVVDIGETISPILYFGLHRLSLDGGAMITGSHNPPDYNGIKMCRSDRALHGQAIQDLRTAIEEEAFIHGAGQRREYDMLPDYMAELRGRFSAPPHRFRVVVDAGNGAAGPVVPPILEAIGHEVVPLFCNVDPTFPNHHPDPAKVVNLETLRQVVLDQGADIGLAFDGDGDRLGVVDNEANIVWGDQMMILFSRDVLKDHPGAKILVEVKCSQVLYDEIERQGGQALWSATGHAIVKDRMCQEKALLAGEMSGHIFFADEYYGFDDAVYAACRLLRIMGQAERPLSELFRQLPHVVNTPEMRVYCSDERKFDVVWNIKEDLKQHLDYLDIDGVRFWTDGGWGLVRASNTQPALIIRAEAGSEADLEGIKNIIANALLQRAGIVIDWTSQGD